MGLAVEMLSAALFGYPGDSPESGLEISHDQKAARSALYDCTVGDIRHDTDSQDDDTRLLRRLSSPERHAKRRDEILQAYITAVGEARRTGAPLYLVNFKAEDFDAVLKQCPEAVDSWLEGLGSVSADFRRRVRLAEGFFVCPVRSVAEGRPVPWGATMAGLANLSGHKIYQQHRDRPLVACRVFRAFLPADGRRFGRDFWYR